MPATSTPIWKSIHAALCGDISSGRYDPGDKLPTEGRTRPAIRGQSPHRAAGPVGHGRRGARLFRPRRRCLRGARRPNIRSGGASASTAIFGRSDGCPNARSCRSRPGPRTPGRRRRLPSRRRHGVHAYEGVSLADGQPLALFLSVFPAERFPGLPDTLRNRKSVTAALQELGVGDYTRVSTRLTAKLATADAGTASAASRGGTDPAHRGGECRPRRPPDRVRANVVRRRQGDPHARGLVIFFQCFVMVAIHNSGNDRLLPAYEQTHEDAMPRPAPDRRHSSPRRRDAEALGRGRGRPHQQGPPA